MLKFRHPGTWEEQEIVDQVNPTPTNRIHSTKTTFNKTAFSNFVLALLMWSDQGLLSPVTIHLSGRDTTSYRCFCIGDWYCTEQERVFDSSIIMKLWEAFSRQINLYISFSDEQGTCRAGNDSRIAKQFICAAPPRFSWQRSQSF